jgi:glycosyltransferase involved in cell wall biosynthesis
LNLDRVVIAVEGSGPSGGAERIAFDTVKLLSQDGIPVTILTSGKEVESSFSELPGVDTIALNLPMQLDRFFSMSKKNMLFNLLEDQAMKELFTSVLQKLDSPTTVLHAHGFHNNFTQAILHVATKSKMKTVVTCHDFGITCPTATLFNYPENRICQLKPLGIDCLKSSCISHDGMRLKQLRFARSWANRRLFRVPQLLNKVLAVSEHERNILQGHFGGAVKVETLHNPVDPASTSRQSPSRSNQFLWTGRMTQEKDGTTPAKVCKDLGKGITFLGDGPFRGEIEAANSNATFLGWLSPEKVKQEQCKARSLILSSRWYETASLVVLECLAAGIPCIIPQQSAATNWVEDEVNGIYFEAGNEASLTRALQKLDDDEYVEMLSINAFERYWKAPFSMGKYKTDLYNHYSEALGT